jgi:hypothetical protein
LSEEPVLKELVNFREHLKRSSKRNVTRTKSCHSSINQEGEVVTEQTFSFAGFQVFTHSSFDVGHRSGAIGGMSTEIACLYQLKKDSFSGIHASGTFALELTYRLTIIVISFDESRKPRVPLHKVMNAANNHVKGVLEDIYKGLSRFDQDADKEANKDEES